MNIRIATSDDSDTVSFLPDVKENSLTITAILGK